MLVPVAPPPMITTSAVSAMAAAYHGLGYRNDGSQERSLSDNASMRDVARPEDPDRRLLSLDVFRGITVAAMVLVNNPGTWRAVYAPLRHADWHGWTPTDLIFPFFLFIVGVAIPLALGRRLAGGEARGRVVQKVLWRAWVIFFLGLVLHAVSSMDPATIRIPGVLQRIAVCYLD